MLCIYHMLMFLSELSFLFSIFSCLCCANVFFFCFLVDFFHQQNVCFLNSKTLNLLLRSCSTTSFPFYSTRWSTLFSVFLGLQHGSRVMYVCIHSQHEQMLLRLQPSALQPPTEWSISASAEWTMRWQLNTRSVFCFQLFFFSPLQVADLWRTQMNQLNQTQWS